MYEVMERGVQTCIVLAIFITVSYYLFIGIGELAIGIADLVTSEPNVFIPISFLLTIGLAWFISSSTSSSTIDGVIGFLTIHILSFLVPGVFYYYIYSALIGSELINSIIIYNEHLTQWIQSFESLLYYVLWGGYILVFFLIIAISTLPIYLSRKACEIILERLISKGIFIIGDIILIAVILSLSYFAMYYMDYSKAIEAIQSFESNMITLFALTLLTTIIGWRKFLKQQNNI